MSEVPKFNGTAFARWLRRYQESEGFMWKDVAHRGGLGRGTMTSLVNNSSGSDYDPAIGIIARVAHGLQLDFGYVLSKAGLPVGKARMDTFSPREREVMVEALGLALKEYHGIFTADAYHALTRLQSELNDTFPPRSKI